MAINNKNKPQPKPVDEIPQKIFYSISEASEFTGVEPHVLRYWETKFSKLNPKRVGGNQRKYTRNDLDLLFEIVHLLYYDGYTLDGAERKLRMGLQALKAEREAEQALKKEESAFIDSNTLENQQAPQKNGFKLDEIKKDLKQILDLLQ